MNNAESNITKAKGGVPQSYSYKNIRKIALPIILGSIAQDLITLVDTAFVGRLGAVELGAVAIGSIFYLAVIMLGFGFGVGVQIIIARRYGENNIGSINTILYHSFFVLLASAIIVFTVLKIYNPVVLNFMVDSEEIFVHSLSYMNIRVWGLFAAFTNIVFRAFYIGTSNTRIIGYTTVLMAVVNILLDKLFIFGTGTLSPLGIKGAAMASVIAEYCAFFYFLLYTALNPKLKKYKLFSIEKIDFGLLKSIFKVSAPTTLQHFISFFAWFLFFLFVEKMGETALAVSNIIRSLYIILILPIMGFASASNTLVSYAVGKNESQFVFLIIKRALVMSLVGIFFLTTLSFFIPETIIGMFTNIDELIKITLPVYYVVMLASYALCFGLILFQAVSGTGNTLHALVIELVTIAGYIAGVYFMSKNVGDKVQYVWLMEIFYGLFLGISGLLYLKFGSWKGKRL